MTQPGGALFARVPKYKQPQIPLILTKKDWDKKKGVFAKLVAGKTGIGEQCLAVEKAYKNVKWARVEMNEALRNNGFENWRSDNFTTGNFKKLMDLAKGEVLGSMKQLSTELYKLRDLCLAAEKKFKADKKIPASSTAHVKEMAKQADALGVAVNQHTLGGYLKSVEEALYGWVKDAVASNIVAAQKTVPPKVSAAVSSLAKDPTPQNLSGHSTGAIRDLNQAVGNAAKYGERGFGKPNPAFRKQFNTLEPFARGSLLPGSATPDEVKAYVEKMKPELKRGIDLLVSFKA